MNYILRQGLLGSTTYYYKTAIITFMTLFVLPYLLGPEQIGLYKYILSTATLFASATQIGISQSIIRFFVKLSPKQKKVLLGFSFVFILSIHLIAYFVFLIYKYKFFTPELGKPNVLVDHFELIFSCTLGIVLCLTIKAWYRTLFRAVFPVLIQNIYVYTAMAMPFLFLYLKIIDYRFLIYSLPALFLSAFIILILNLVRLGELKVSFRLQELDLSFYKDFLIYNLFSFAGSSGFTLVTKIDTFMIVPLLGLKQNGIYATVLALADIVEVPRRGLKQITVPALSRLIASEDQSTLKNFYKNISLCQFVNASFFFCIIISNIDHVFTFLPKGDIFSTGKNVVIFLMISRIFDSMLSYSLDILSLSKYFKYSILFIAFLISVSVGLNYLLIPIYGISGAAAATALSYLIYNSAAAIFINKNFNLNPISKKMLFPIIFMTASTTLRYIPLHSTLLVSALIKLSLILIAYIYYISKAKIFNFELGFSIPKENTKLS